MDKMMIKRIIQRKNEIKHWFFEKINKVGQCPS